ncbi:NADH dehydrogenase [ubiquinone] 1 beta subcomplex subunit 9-like protein [Tanacetum coccineum]
MKRCRIDGWSPAVSLHPPLKHRVNQEEEVCERERKRNEPGGFADALRERFDANKNVEDIETIDRMIAHGEAQYNKWRHPDPYIVPWAPGGSKFTRNPEPPKGIEIVYDYGREEHLT